MTRTLLTLSLMALVAAPAAWAATPINQTRPLDARGHVEIENVKGRIQVRTWDKNEVQITGSLGKGVEKLVVEGDEGDLVVRVEYPRHGSGWGSNLLPWLSTILNRSAVWDGSSPRLHAWRKTP